MIANFKNFLNSYFKISRNIKYIIAKPNQINLDFKKKPLEIKYKKTQMFGTTTHLLI